MGPTGATGAQGATGADGPQGPAGPQGVTGTAGANGADGATGATGAAGADGANGAQGPAGPQGATGATGAEGPAGADGAQGPTGADGAEGPIGPTGPAGADWPGATVRKTGADDATTGTALVNATGLDLALAANTTYSFEYYILFQTAATTTGLSVAVNGPASPTLISYTAQVPGELVGNGGGAPGTGMYSDWGTALDDQITATGVQAANTTYVAHVSGVIRTGATAGTLRPRFRSEVNGSAVTIKTYSWGALYSG